MTQPCEACTAARVNPKLTRRTDGCVSCIGRMLAVAGFTLDQLSDRHPPEVIAAFEQWEPLVRQQRVSQPRSEIAKT